MNLPFFIARRIAKNKKASFSRMIIRLATAATALSVAIMIIAVAMVQGFKYNIEQKLFSFWGHFHITSFNPSPEGLLSGEGMVLQPKLEDTLQKLPEVLSINTYALKPAILKGSSTLTGLKLKGIQPNFPTTSSLALQYEGKKIDFGDTAYSKDILLSPAIMERLDVKFGDPVLAYFVEQGQSTPRIRKLTVAGSFHTGVGEIDNSFALCDMRLIQNLNGWARNQVSGYQVAVHSLAQMDPVSQKVYKDYLQQPLVAESMRDIYPSIFSWLEVQNINAVVLLVIMIIVAVINIATALLIFILERTQMIGMLKGMGMRNAQIQGIFLYHSLIISLRGILLGNLLAGILCWLQSTYHFVTLDESVYYMPYAPIRWSWMSLILIDLGTLLLCFLLLLIPTIMARRVNIIKALHFR